MNDQLPTEEARVLGDPVGGITLRHGPDGSVVTLWGEIDGSLRNDASAVLAAALERDQSVVIDLGDVTFMDSTGIAFLVQFCTIGAEEGLDVTVQRPPSLVRDVLEMLGVAEMLGLVPEQTSAPSSAALAS